jgi:hypothetical protein
MRKGILSLLAILIAVFTLGNIVSAQPPTLMWSQMIGGQFSQYLNGLDLAYSNGYVTVGTQVQSVNGDTSCMVFMQFDGNGSVLWQNSIQPGTICYGANIRRSWDNASYVISGSSRPTYNAYSTLHLIKLNAQGNVQWVGNYGNGTLGQETDVACAYTSDYILLGNIYNAGQFIRLFKVNQNGTEIWNKTIGGYYSRGQAITEAFDPGFYIAGSVFSFPNSSNDFYLVKVNADGDTLWTKSWGDSACWEEYADIARTNDGKLVAVGNRWISGQNEIVLTKFDLDGNILWTRDIGQYESYNAKTVSQDWDNGYIIAGSTDTQNAWTCTLVKTNSQGYVRWIARPQAGNISSFSAAIPFQYSSGGYIAVGSSNVQSIFVNEFFARIYSDPTAPVSATPYAPCDINLPYTGGQFNFSLTVTNGSSYAQIFDLWTVIDLPNVGQVQVLVAQGKTIAELGGISRNLTQFVPALAPPGVYTYNIYIGNFPWTINYHDSFNFTKSGTAGDGGWTKDGWICSGWGEENVAATTATAKELPTIFCSSTSPNPFNPTTTISFTLPETGQVNLSVYDINGRQVASLVNGFREAGSHQVNFDGSNLASGIYLYRLAAGKYSATGKMMLMK